ncbi:F0F1 ATP synthase subunit B family protein [Sphingomonas sp. Ag1]|jgi:F-type H+-transporting ATPase subunit b|uniref:F0F1 ATP synthase subunit B family protein n=1 Tax=Sphingomonas sp. Ag1 TaxID=1642949 RepID=UPI000621CDE8|nr:ATPase [Sphingomonas sp. Ag1]KKI19145.1 ATPase [Sphingomonas sp. Ag1]
MPQISQLAATWASQLFWLVITFGIVFFVVGRGMLPKVQKTIDSRDRSIAADLAAASAARDAADKVEADWRVRDQANREKAQALVAEARQRAAKATEKRLSLAAADQAQQIAAAEADIKAATERALGEIETIAAEAAQEIVARVSGIQVSTDEARGAVKASMANG